MQDQDAHWARWERETGLKIKPNHLSKTSELQLAKGPQGP